MKRILITAMQSGAGKTVLTCALLRLLRNMGIETDCFKCGPDYIDPMFHARAQGKRGGNLDLFLQGEKAVHDNLHRQTQPVLVLEGAMGWFDGLGGTEKGSAWDLAAAEHIPALLCVRPGGSALTLAAQIRGLMSFREPDMIRGLFLTQCRPSLYAYLKPVLERECGLPVLGYLPAAEALELGSRHLGLVTAGEVTDLDERLDRAADLLKETIDLERLLDLSSVQGPDEDDGKKADRDTVLCRESAPRGRCRIAVASDEAFCFYYRESLAALEECGASLLPFSPIRDTALPPCDGLYLGGGYPELHAKELSENETMRRSIRQALMSGMPVIAECGGFLYLQKELRDGDGQLWPMAGVLPGSSSGAGHLVRFGYASLSGQKDSLLFRAGEQVPVHEFHHWDSTANGEDLCVKKADGRTWRCGYTSDTMYAAFPHLHLGGRLPLAERFVRKAEETGRFAANH